MAKTLKDFLEGYLKVKSADEQKFIDKHVTAKNPDRNGNGDDVFKGNTKPIDRRKERKGYNPGEDEKVYEGLSESTYEFDVSGEHGNAAVDKLVKHANSKGIKAKVHTYNGPGGGNPVIHLSHKDPKVVHSYAKKHIDPDVDLAHHKINEELKGNQHKIDANKNGKVDAHDFKLLRSKKKIAEGMDRVVDNGHTPIGSATQHAAKLISSHTKRKHYFDGGDLVDHETDKTVVHNAASKPIHVVKKLAKDYHAGVKEEAEQIDELDTATLKSYRTKARAQGNAIVDKMKMGGGDWSKDQKDTKTLRKRAAGANMSGKQLVKRGESLKTEEVEELEELSKNTLHSYIEKSAQDVHNQAYRAGKKEGGEGKYDSGKILKSLTRQIGISKATRKLAGKAKVNANEEVEPIEELSKQTLRSYAQNAKDQMSRSDTLAGREMGARNSGAKPSAKERMHNRRADKRHAGLGLAIDKLAREEVEHIEEAGYSAKAARAGKDIGKPGKQFAKIASAAAKKYGSAERGQKVAGAVLAKLRKEEKLADLISDLSESHQRTMMNVFEKLNEDNKSKFLEACDTPDGVEQMLDFAINHRGE